MENNNFENELVREEEAVTPEEEAVEVIREVVEEVAEEPVEEVAEEPAEESVEEPAEEPVQKKKGKGAVIAVVAAVLICALGVGGWFGVRALLTAKNYEKAVALAGQEQYDEAKALFEELGDYEDSAARLEELNRQQKAYDEARALMEQKKLTEAKEAFAALGQYRDCPELQQYIDAKIAFRSAKKAKDYAAVAEQFQALGQVEDSQDMVVQCYMEAALAAVEEDKNPDKYLEKLTQEQVEQFEAQFKDEEILAGWEQALQARFEMEPREDDIQRYDFDEELEILKPLVKLPCRDQDLKDLLDRYYEAVELQQYNLTANDNIDDYTLHYEMELERSLILNEMFDSYGFLKDNDELYEKYMDKEEHFQMFMEIEKSLDEWSMGGGQVKQRNGRKVLEYTNDTGYDFSMDLAVIYFDEKGGFLGQEEYECDVEDGQTIVFYLTYPKGTKGLAVATKLYEYKGE